MNVKDNCIWVIWEFWILDKVLLFFGIKIRLVKLVIFIGELCIFISKLLELILLKSLLRIVEVDVMLGFIVMWFVVFCLIMIFEDLDENDVSLWCVML